MRSVSRVRWRTPRISRPAGLAAWEARERPLTEHTQLWTRIYGNTLFLPGPLKRTAIRAEQRIPWLAAQYARAANHIPTGTTPV
jgi:hypothetical protein